jgi:hypothetical protein
VMNADRFDLKGAGREASAERSREYAPAK